jgi:hypothetical protein
VDRSGGPLSRETFAAAHGASAADLAAVKAFADSHGLSEVQEQPARRTLVVAGTVAQFNLYAHPTALRAITQGTNGAFEASAGWDACTGLGSPIGQQVAAVIGVPLAEQKGSS